MKRNLLAMAAVCVSASILCTIVRAETVGDLATLDGAPPMQVKGLGIVSGPHRTGKNKVAERELFHRYLIDNKVRFESAVLDSGTLAVVTVSAEIPAYSRLGMRLQVQVRAMGDETSLDGGVLLACNLYDNRSPDPVATASGRVIVNSKLPWLGTIPAGPDSGALLVAALPVRELINEDGFIRLNTKYPSWRVANDIIRNINLAPHLNPYLQDAAANSEGLICNVVAYADNPKQVFVKAPSFRYATIHNFITQVLELPISTFSDPAFSGIPSEDGTRTYGDSKDENLKAEIMTPVLNRTGSPGNLARFLDTYMFRPAAALTDIASGRPELVETAINFYMEYPHQAVSALSSAMNSEDASLRGAAVLAVYTALSAGSTGKGAGIRFGSELGRFDPNTVPFAGYCEKTDRWSDLYIDERPKKANDNFFCIDLGDGYWAYTRNGRFIVNEDGELISELKYPLIPKLDALDPAALEVIITPSGHIFQKLPLDGDFRYVDQLRLFRFENPAGLESIGNGIFVETEASGCAMESNPGDASYGFGWLRSGFIERPTVDFVTRMTRLITGRP